MLARQAALAMAILGLVSCVRQQEVPPSASEPIPAASTAIATAQPSPGPTTHPAIDLVECADVDLFIERTHAGRVAAAGPDPRPVASPTVPPPGTTPPPLGRLLLADSPVADYATPAFDGFLATAQDLGPAVTGQSLDLARRSGVLWGYSRTWTPASGPGGFTTYVYEFWSVDGAIQFEEGAARGACLSGGSLFEVSGISAAIGQNLRYGFPPYASRASFVRGNRRYVVEFISTAPVAPARVAEAARIALAIAR